MCGRGGRTVSDCRGESHHVSVSSRTSADAELTPVEYLFVEDIRSLLRCGDTKARLIMRALPSVRIGSRSAVLKSDLLSYIDEHGGIQVRWPKRKR